MWPPSDSPDAPSRNNSCLPYPAPSRNISDDDGDDIDDCVDLMHRDSLDNSVFLYPNKKKVQSSVLGALCSSGFSFQHMLVGSRENVGHTSWDVNVFGNGDWAPLCVIFICISSFVPVPNYADPISALLEECNHLYALHTNNGAACNQKYDVDECNTWSKVFEEAEDLLSHENANRSSSSSFSLAIENFQKGSKRKSKLRFSFNQSSCKEASSPRDRKSGNAMSSVVSEFHSGLEGLQQGSVPHSMAELLEGLGKQNDSLQPSDPSALTRRRSHLLRKRNLDSSVYGLKQNAYVPELPDDGISSEEEAAQPVSQREPTSFFDIAPLKDKTMADHFMEVFDFNAMNDDSAIPNNKQRGFGYFGKLQQIMHGEKERHTNFLKEVQKGTIAEGETRFFDVEIVSRCLEAKLTVCCCLLSKKAKRSEHMKSFDGEMESRTVVFSSRMCNNVELEIGKLIRVYAPWEEVRLPDGRIVFLSTYFSETLT